MTRPSPGLAGSLAPFAPASVGACAGVLLGLLLAPCACHRPRLSAAENHAGDGGSVLRAAAPPEPAAKPPATAATAGGASHHRLPRILPGHGLVAEQLVERNAKLLDNRVER